MAIDTGGVPVLIQQRIFIAAMGRIHCRVGMTNLRRNHLRKDIRYRRRHIRTAIVADDAGLVVHSMEQRLALRIVLRMARRTAVPCNCAIGAEGRLFRAERRPLRNTQAAFRRHLSRHAVRRFRMRATGPSCERVYFA